MNTSNDPIDVPRVRRKRAQLLDLDREVRRLLELHRGHGQWKAISAATDVSYSWLSKFSRGKITNPGYATLRRLHTLLAGWPVMPPVPSQPLPPDDDQGSPPPTPMTLAMSEQPA